MTALDLLAKVEGELTDIASELERDWEWSLAERARKLAREIAVETERLRRAAA